MAEKIAFVLYITVLCAFLYMLLVFVLDGKYFMVGKVGTGLNESTRNFLKDRLTRNHGFLKNERLPEWIHRDLRTDDIPTDYIHMDNFQVVEVRIANSR